MRAAPKTFALVFLVFACLPGAASEQPDQLIKSIVSDVLAAYAGEQGSPQKDPDFLRRLIEEDVLPHIDFPMMSKLVLGKHWRQATDEQRRRFIDGFRALLIRTYSRPLSAYRGQQILFSPYRKGKDPNRATVDTKIVPHNGIPVPVSYRLRFSHEDGWKVYDISVDAISMVSNYRSTFSTAIARSGLPPLIDTLSKREVEVDRTTAD